MSNQNGSGKSLERSAGGATEPAPPFHVPTIDLRDYVVEPAVLALVPKLLCERHTSLPLSRTGDVLVVVMADPGNPITYDELGAHTGLHVEAVTAPEPEILAAIAKYYETSR